MKANKDGYGYCHCGCGQRTRIAPKTSTALGHVKGQPLRYINGHNTRKTRTWTVVDRGHTTPCWEWDGTISVEGYGVLRENYLQVKAHRWVYAQLRGPVPDDRVIDHLCLNKRCVNPDHLDVVTGAENSRRFWRARLDGRVSENLPEGVTA